MRNALKTFMKLLLKVEWINTADNDDDNDDDDDKKLACIQLGKKMSFERNDHTCKNAGRLVLNFCTASLVKGFFFFFSFIFDLLFSNMRAYTHTSFLRTQAAERYGDCGLSCARVIIAPFLRKLAVGLSLQWQMRWRFHAVAAQLLLKRWQNAERHSSQCHMESSKMEWAIFALASPHRWVYLIGNSSFFMGTILLLLRNSVYACVFFSGEAFLVHLKCH